MRRSELCRHLLSRILPHMRQNSVGPHELIFAFLRLGGDS